jgi:hypothetical protein
MQLGQVSDISPPTNLPSTPAPASARIAVLTAVGGALLARDGPVLAAAWRLHGLPLLSVICDYGFADDVCPVAPAVHPLPGALEEQELRVFMDEITHACAVTVHRSQGPEYPCVVLPLSTSAWLMLRRYLLSTAVTRAKRLVVLVGSKRAIACAVRTEGAGRRYAALAERLRRGHCQGPGQRTG